MEIGQMCTYLVYYYYLVHMKRIAIILREGEKPTHVIYV